MPKRDMNAARLKKSYDRLCFTTYRKIGGLGEDADMRVIKDAFSAIKEGVNIGRLLEEGAGTLTVIFEGDAGEAAR